MITIKKPREYEVKDFKNGFYEIFVRGDFMYIYYGEDPWGVFHENLKKLLSKNKLFFAVHMDEKKKMHISLNTEVHSSDYGRITKKDTEHTYIRVSEHFLEVDELLLDDLFTFYLFFKIYYDKSDREEQIPLHIPHPFLKITFSFRGDIHNFIRDQNGYVLRGIKKDPDLFRTILEKVEPMVNNIEKKLKEAIQHVKLI